MSKEYTQQNIFLNWFQGLYDKQTFEQIFKQ